MLELIPTKALHSHTHTHHVILVVLVHHVELLRLTSETPHVSHRCLCLELTVLVLRHTTLHHVHHHHLLLVLLLLLHHVGLRRHEARKVRHETTSLRFAVISS